LPTVALRVSSGPQWIHEINMTAIGYWCGNPPARSAYTAGAVRGRPDAQAAVLVPPLIVMVAGGDFEKVFKKVTAKPSEKSKRQHEQ
jgi:hypothetical protein